MPALLHGTLLVTIFGMDRLQTGWGFNTCCGKELSPRKFLSAVKRTVLCRPEVVGAKLYATVDLDKARVARTRMVDKNPSRPVWDEKFYIYCAHMTSNVVFTVKNDELVGATLLGRAYLPVEAIYFGREVERQVPILDEDRTPTGAKIHVKVEYIRAISESDWSLGIRSGQYQGVPRTFFSQRRGCRVTLYQDAHVPDDFAPRINLSDGKLYEPQRCWEDIFDAISNARHFIYITGWSVYTNITLIRDPRRMKLGDDQTLGELLKTKAEEKGMTVLVLVWDDRTSVEEFRKDGLMATHDQETEEYFRNSKVHCYLCPRNPDVGRSIVQGFETSTMFTHHQKTVVVDGEVEGSQKRRVVSFVGGIDLCDGRYDTMEHPLFRSLNNAHAHDFHQPNFSGASIEKGGPREPWHDIHCRLEGPVAWDVLYNFEQRWKRQVGDKFLIPFSKLDQILIQATTSAIMSNEDSETWNVQVFRSIDGGAVTGFPVKQNEAEDMGLVTGKDNVIDRSIQDAYIHAIRRAKNFIYIENQYFLGSSFGWKESSDIKIEDINALHLIPKELSLKIVSKIEAGEKFCVYVVLPMWPEGIPESASVQAILDWQRRTIEMMYSDITEALQHQNIATNPRDYLTFFCLGNREEHTNFPEYMPPQKPDPDTDYSRAQQARRFMIYVHSKMMIVDDEYIIIGSANINQRSMDGARDSEIAMGAFQPHHIAETKPARGHIYGFRMALWLEHLGVRLEDSFNHPETVECVRRVNQVAQRNWDHYSKDTFNGDIPGHLLRYPIEVSSMGDITPLPGFEFFPDTKAKVLGAKSDYLPPILTT